MGDDPVKQKKNKRFVPTRTFADRPEDINRNGRPKKEHSLTDLLKETLNQPATEKGKTKKQEVIDKMYEIAVTKGDVQMLKYLIDRVDGKPLQQIEADIKTEGFQINIIEPPEGE